MFAVMGVTGQVGRAVANALIANEDMTGRDCHRSPALPRHRLAEILSRTREA